MIKFKILISFFTLILIVNNIVYADDIDIEDSADMSKFIEASSNINSQLKINSRSAIIYDRNSGIVLYGKNENEKRKMASTTKIMTCIIVLESSNLEDIVTVSSKAANTGGSRLGLKTNDKISVKHLLYGLMLCSGNDAAVALAEHVGENIFRFFKFNEFKS